MESLLRQLSGIFDMTWYLSGMSKSGCAPKGHPWEVTKGLWAVSSPLSWFLLSLSSF